MGSWGRVVRLRLSFSASRNVTSITKQWRFLNRFTSRKRSRQRRLRTLEVGERAAACAGLRGASRLAVPSRLPLWPSQSRSPNLLPLCDESLTSCQVRTDGQDYRMKGRASIGRWPRATSYRRKTRCRMAVSLYSHWQARALPVGMGQSHWPCRLGTSREFTRNLRAIGERGWHPGAAGSFCKISHKTFSNSTSHFAPEEPLNDQHRPL